MRTKKFLSLLLVAAMVITIMPAAFAYTSPQVGIELIPNEPEVTAEGGTFDDEDIVKYPVSTVPYTLSKNSFYNFGSNGADKAPTLPESFDLRDTGRVTSVKDQTDYGMCWAFGAVGSAESIYLTNTGKTLDLSEVGLTFFTWFMQNDPLGGLEGDNIVNTNPYDEEYKQQGYLNGGNAYLAEYTLAKWLGPIQEKVAPYQRTADWLNENISNKLSGTYAYSKDVAHLTSGWEVPMSATSYVKLSLIMNGAAQVSYNHQFKYLYWNLDNGAYYYNASRGTNHSVTLVGWDDNYPKENFGTKTASYDPLQPEGNGAWLIKGSWGPNAKGHNDGYLWISYYDTALRANTAVFQVIEDARYQYNYQLDGGVVDGIYQAEKAGDSITYANVFTAQDDIEVGAAMVYYYDAFTDCTINVYTGVETDPSTGTLAYTQDTQSLFPGWYTQEFDSTVPVAAGEKFAVEVVLQDDVNQVYAVGDHPYYEVPNYFTSYGSANAEESYLKMEGDTSYTDAGKSDSVNFRIKALANKGSANIKITQVDVSSNKVNIGDRVTATAYACGGKKDYTYIFSVYDENGNAVYTSDKLNGNYFGYVFDKVGTYTIRVYAYDANGVKSNLGVSSNIVVGSTAFAVKGISVDKTTVTAGEAFTFTCNHVGTTTGVRYLFRVYDANGKQLNATKWQDEDNFSFTYGYNGTLTCTVKVSRADGTTTPLYTSENVSVIKGSSYIINNGVTADIEKAVIGDTITFTGSYGPVEGTNVCFLFRVYDSNGVQQNATRWQTANTFEFVATKVGDFYCTYKVKDVDTGRITDITTSAVVTVLEEVM